MNSFIGISFLYKPFANGCLSLTIKHHDNEINIFKAWFPPVGTTNSHSVRINLIHSVMTQLESIKHLQ